jgi:hypothetical protein
MSTTATAQPVLTIVKDEFTKVITKGTLSPITKPTDWNVVITKKALLEAMKTPSPPPEKIWHGLATLYDNTFSTHKEYYEFTVNHLTMWGNTLDYKLSDTLYMTHWYHAHTIKRLCEQAMALLEEANKINEWIWWSDTRLRVMSEQSLDLTFDNESKSCNEFEL